MLISKLFVIVYITINNYGDIEWVLKNTENLEYNKMVGYDDCCGLSGLTNFREYRVLSRIFKNKQKNIIVNGSKNVLTSCLGCETALKVYSFNKYKVFDLLEFLAKNS